MKAKKVYESIGDILKGKSKEDIEKLTSNLSPYTLLIKSAEIGFIKGVELALDRGADVHASDDLALRWAAIHGNLDVLKLLLDRGADVHVDNDYAFRWAANDEVIKLLNKYRRIKESLGDVLKPKPKKEIEKLTIKLKEFKDTINAIDPRIRAYSRDEYIEIFPEEEDDWVSGEWLIVMDNLDNEREEDDILSGAYSVELIEDNGNMNIKANWLPYPEKTIIGINTFIAHLKKNIRLKKYMNQ